jgi:hypothetical protein
MLACEGQQSKKIQKMRKRFEQQLKIGQQPIADTFITTKSRDPYIPIMRTLKEIFITPELHARYLIF